MPASSRPFTARHVQLSRAVMAAVAAIMITFSPDHSAAVGLSVFGGFAIVTSFVLILAAIIVYPNGRRWPAVMMGAFTLVLGMAASVPAWRSDTLFFVLVITWAALTGLVELLAGIRYRGTEGARDAITVGGLGLLLALLMAVIPVDLVQHYTVDGKDFVLTGIVLGVGMFGGYAALVAVFLGIAGFTPGAKKHIESDAGGDRLADHGGYA
ncbi:acyl-CoA synthetase [Microbacterium sp. H1-D42]|uniref:acyl-CoA synthetase n=1 Tax=Microbacterium sp. H1-D42 TaxID=2925844 RepID=UPI001F52E998|nr:acyl-CoA synthetase [Microbacterium sp. H1-D42]UNK70975.1 acyl-CoA synthetase [Microbacterium sp. H1-D42]